MTQVSNPFNDYVFVNATPAERGSFSLAMEKALEKLEKFQLPDATFFILQWVQSIVASGAQKIHIKYETQRITNQYTLELNFDGPGFSAKELSNMYDHVFLSGRDRGVDRLRELALGWLSACSLNPHRVSLQSNGWFRLREKSAGKNEVCSQTPTEDAEGNPLEQAALHQLHLSGRGDHDFYALMHGRCGDVPIPLYFNGEAISTGAGLSGVPWPNRSFESGPTRGVMGATYGGAATSQVAFLRYGVNFVSRSEEALEPAVIVRVKDATLSKNVSQTDVVRDDAYGDFLERIRREMKTMALALTSKRIPGYQRESLNHYIQAYLGSHLDVRALDDPERIKLLGEDYESLLKFPVFISAGGKFVSVYEIYQIYKQTECLLYCADEMARTSRWAGLLLILSPEEVMVVKKFCPNLIAISLAEVRNRAKTAGGGFSRAETKARPLASRTRDIGDRTYRIIIPDSYPTGEAVLQNNEGFYRTAIPGVKATVIAEYSVGGSPNDTEVMQLAKQIPDVLKGLLAEICAEIKDADSFSRLRYAELACELANVLLETEPYSSQPPAEAVAALGATVRLTDLIGLEDGRMVSIADLEAYLKVTPSAYLGGLFVDGVESGAIDPMPCAEALIHKVFSPHQLVPTERIRDRLEQDPSLKVALRRQTVMRGLGVHPDPAKAIEQFANEAAAQAEELKKLEAEYRKAMEGPELFVKPDAARLAELAEEEGGDFELLDLEAEDAPTASSPTTSPAHAPTQVLGPPPLPSLDADLEFCREADPDFLPPGPSIHVERKEETFTLHLATRRRLSEAGRIFFLEGSSSKKLTHPLPIDGFIRVSPAQQHSAESLIGEAIEQLLHKVVPAFREGPQTSMLRKQLRDWLHLVGCLEPQRLLASQSRHNWLFDLAVVPCLGQKFLTWRTLREQYDRDQKLLTAEADLAPSTSREVVKLVGPVTPELLRQLGFENLKQWQPEDKGKPDFEALYRATRRDLSTTLAGTDTPLLRPGLIAKLAEDASFFRRWRSGFLRWDDSQEIAVMNPKHKVGKKLVKQFGEDPSWSAVFASALFSTINRGLEEVEDYHERAFLEALLESLD